MPLFHTQPPAAPVRFFSPRFAAACLLLAAFAWSFSAQAIPPAEVDTTPVQTKTATAKATGTKTAKANTKNAKNAKAAPKAVAETAPATQLASAKMPLSASQMLVKHDILAQPSAGFVCPHADGGSATECFLDGVEHLYTVCRNVKAIELIEFGFAKGEEGSNGFKSEFCRRKQIASMPGYFDAALREARTASSCLAVQQLNDLYAVWHTTMAGLRQHPQETETEYKERILVPYLAFAAYREQIRESIADATKGKKPLSCPTVAVYTP